jgi:hypothetical protein
MSTTTTISDPNRCGYCSKAFSSAAAVSRHQGQDPICKIRLQKSHIRAMKAMQERLKAPKSDFSGNQLEPGAVNSGYSIDDNSESAYPTTEPSNTMDCSDHATIEQDDVDAVAPTHRIVPSRRATVVDENEDDTISNTKRWRQRFPKESEAGKPVKGKHLGKTAFESIEDDHILRYGEVLGPFQSEDEWELAKWLIKNVGHTQMDAFLKLPIVSILNI